jgi:hypothetical protein
LFSPFPLGTARISLNEEVTLPVRKYAVLFGGLCFTYYLAIFFRGESQKAGVTQEMRQSQGSVQQVWLASGLSRGQLVPWP